MLQKLVDMWDVHHQYFVVRDQVLNLEVEDIYVFIGLSLHGATMFLVGARRGRVEKVDDYVAHYCHPGTQKRNNKLPIGKVHDLTLCTILFTITQAVGSTIPHLASRSQVDYSMMCMSSIMYNWCGAVFTNMKDQLKM
jgi:hypothetical protein